MDFSAAWQEGGYRGDRLRMALHLKEDAHDYLSADKLKEAA